MSASGFRPRSPFGWVPDEIARDPKVTDAAVRMFAVLTRYAGLSGGAFPSRQTLADEMGWKISKVTETAKKLAAAGYITVEANWKVQHGERVTKRPGEKGPGRRTTNRYEIASRFVEQPTNGVSRLLEQPTVDRQTNRPSRLLEQPERESHLRKSEKRGGAPTPDADRAAPAGAGVVVPR